MTTTPRRSWMVWYAVILHFAWAVLLIWSTAPLRVTALAEISVRIDDRRGALAVFLVAVASLAMVGLLMQRLPGFTRLALLAPQQLALGISAGGAVHAMALGRYADGVPRPIAFIVADQIPAVLAFVLHALAVSSLHQEAAR